MSVDRVYLNDVIGTYFEMGNSALERHEYAIAQKMFKAVFEEPSTKLQKDKLMLPLLVASAKAHLGLKQLYKAKLFYIRALAFKNRNSKIQDFQNVEILIALALLTTQQGLYRQALDFASEAFDSYKKCEAKEPIEFVKRLRQIEKQLQLKGRQIELQQITEIMHTVKMQALFDLPKSSAILPSENVIVLHQHAPFSSLT